MESASSLSPSFSLSHPRTAVRTLVSRGAGKREQEPEILSTVDRGAAHVLSHPLPPQQPRWKRLWGRNRAGPLNTLIVKGIEV